MGREGTFLTHPRWCGCWWSRTPQDRQQTAETYGISVAKKIFLPVSESWNSKQTCKNRLSWLSKSAWLLHLEIGLTLGPPDKLWQPLGHRFLKSPSFKSGKCCRIHQSQRQDSVTVTLGGKDNFCSTSDLNLCTPSEGPGRGCTSMAHADPVRASGSRLQEVRHSENSTASPRLWVPLHTALSNARHFSGSSPTPFTDFLNC